MSNLIIRSGTSGKEVREEEEGVAPWRARCLLEYAGSNVGLRLASTVLRGNRRQKTELVGVTACRAVMEKREARCRVYMRRVRVRVWE